MSEPSGSKYATLIFGGVVSVGVGVASGYGVNWLSEKNGELTYDITAIQAFPGQEKIGIVSVKISNPGKKELENIDANIQFSDAEVKEAIFQGLAPQASKKESKGLRFQMPFINPGENFSVQLLVAPTGSTLSKPTVDVRGKGAVAIPLDANSKKSEEINQFAALGVSTLSTLAFASLVVSRRLRQKRISFGTAVDALLNDPDGNSRHLGDQRDIFAFILGLCGFPEIACELRAIGRETSYWSISDSLTERWITTPDEGTIRSACNAFEKLIEYARIAEESQGVLLLNAARLCLSINDRIGAKTYLNRSKAGKESIVARRIAMSFELSELDKEA